MKFIFILVLVQAAITISVVKAQRISNLYFRKPVVDLNKKIIIATRLLPQERRKSSIFPKNTQKFVVTSPPYSKVRKYTLRPISKTKKTFEPVYRPSITREESVTKSTLLRSFDTNFYKPKKVSAPGIHRVVEDKHVNNNKGRYKISRNRYIESQIKDDSEEISTDLPEFADELTKDYDNNVLADVNTLSELDNIQVKKPVAQNPISIHDSWYFKNIARVPNDNSHMDYDKDEFIFLDNKNKKLSNNSPSKTSTDHKTSRSKRSDNVIEEEPRVTTDFRFSIGPEPRLNSDLVFKNIHA